MAAARVASIASVVSLQAKDLDGVWRALTEGSAVSDREEILCEADGAQYGLAAYKLQQRASGSWVDAQSVALDLPEGTSNYRQDRIGVDGDDTDSTVAIVLGVDKGQALLRDLLTTLKRQERAFFTLEGGSTKFRGIVDDVEEANKVELGGMEQDFKGVLLADREQFVGATPAAPQRGQQMKLLGNGRTYRIEGVRSDEISYAIEFVSVNA